MEYSSDNDNSNSKSEYFAAISSTVITEQPYPQMNFSKNAKILSKVNDQTTTSSKDGIDSSIHILIYFASILYCNK